MTHPSASSVLLLSNDSVTSRRLSGLISQVVDGLRHHEPELCDEGVNATYFLRNKHGKRVAVFKPVDERKIEGSVQSVEFHVPSSPYTSQGGTISVQWRIGSQDDTANNSSNLNNNNNNNDSSSSYEDNNCSNNDLDPFSVSSPCSSPSSSFGSYTEDYDFPASPSSSSFEAPLSPDQCISGSEAALREVAAYSLDPEHFCGVPVTALVRLEYEPPRSSRQQPHRRSSVGAQRPRAKSYPEVPSRKIVKIGSLQEYVESEGSAWDVGTSMFPVREVHKIGILDLQLFNLDRHDGNMLFSRRRDGTLKLTPIDHGFSLPTSLTYAWFGWLNWKQAKQPFDRETRDYVRRIDMEKNARALKRLGFSEDSIRTMKITTTLLMKGVDVGLSLHDIGSIASRSSETPSDPSELERMCQAAMNQAQDLFSSPAHKLHTVLLNTNAQVSRGAPGSNTVLLNQGDVSAANATTAGSSPTVASSSTMSRESEELFLEVLNRMLDDKLPAFSSRGGAAPQAQGLSSAPASTTPAHSTFVPKSIKTPRAGGTGAAAGAASATEIVIVAN